MGEEPEKVLVHDFIDPVVPKAILTGSTMREERILNGDAYNTAQP